MNYIPTDREIKTQVELLGGEIVVRSELQEGTSFSIAIKKSMKNKSIIRVGDPLMIPIFDKKNVKLLKSSQIPHTYASRTCHISVSLHPLLI